VDSPRKPNQKYYEEFVEMSWNIFKSNSISSLAKEYNIKGGHKPNLYEEGILPNTPNEKYKPRSFGFII